MFNTSNSCYSLSDIAAATGGSDNRNNDGWGDSGAWWIIILFLFCFAGWGNGGWGGNGSNGSGFQGTTTREEIAYGFDMNGLENSVRGVQNGLCDGFYALNNSMLTGFANAANSTAQGFYGLNNSISDSRCTLENAITNSSIANMQNTNAIQSDIAGLAVAGIQNTNALTSQLNAMSAANQACCCETQRQIERGFCDLNYNLATQSCDTRQVINDSTRDIIASQNEGVRSILDFLTQDKIATLTAENQSLKFAASQQAQNAYLVGELAPKVPTAAYVVPNPFTGSYGLNSGCGCGCGCGTGAYTA